MKRFSFSLISLLTLVYLASPLWAETTVHINPLPSQPVVDGSLDEWGSDGWQSLETKSSLMDEEGEEDERSSQWQPGLQLKTGAYKDHFYMAVKWRDDAANTIYKPWKKQGNKYSRSNRKDDMFAVRFELRGDFNSCMVSNRDYEVDMWLWSAGRSNLVGTADDMYHRYSTKLLDPAIEIPTRQGVVYIQKILDEGEGGWGYSRAPAQMREELVTSVVKQGTPSGSRAHVVAVGVWKDGYWHLELSRGLRNKDGNDVQFMAEKPLIGQLAVFNADYHMAKKVTHKLTFDFSQMEKGVSP
ncbi:MAG: hypothetical protein G8345_08575 [Magnetococcales bacterium]|nr:hypothetical protein [Magnetococcales bacterium]NGZ26929.1 hypothetical protein [Magnetococcales bacterium]